MFREKLLVEHLVSKEDETTTKTRYKRGTQIPIRDKRIFGIMTRYQVGYIPGVDVCFTDDD